MNAQPKEIDTPRTNGAANESIVSVYEESKKLERELAEARETHKMVANLTQRDLNDMSHRLTMANIERDKLRAQLAEARSTVEKCWECETKLRAELAQANERIEAKQQAYERCAEQLAEATTLNDNQVGQLTEMVLLESKLRAELEGTIATMNISTKFEEIVNAFPQWLGDRKELVNLRAEVGRLRDALRLIAQQRVASDDHLQDAADVLSLFAEKALTKEEPKP